MYEKKTQAMLGKKAFWFRAFTHLLMALGFITLTLIIGALGHWFFEDDIHWHEAAIDAALVIGGIGVSKLPATIGGRLFYAMYGVYVSLAYAVAVSIVVLPFAHRILHKFHQDDERENDKDDE
ncbi:hypothetical protein [Alcaligenes endophyticus]|uniref:Two pore domain potassium channel family protein n=1 Tax=Alcaligenes endophyticus TaxID=1929088 RepID=A0ABT8EF62_9BURK|nr:hypothetical protein [Alcaligenes endophyticus]MCX5590411.1 hypothetical protein [Alcaligenes endophyticus]MDN4119925.1 hypothetical protein [Alcaligenes endophyticus]